jgi:hypothetical protein
VLVQFHYIYTKGEALPSKHEGATLRKIGQAILCGFKTQKKIVKNPLQKGTQSIGT